MKTLAHYTTYLGPECFDAKIFPYDPQVYCWTSLLAQWQLVRPSAISSTWALPMANFANANSLELSEPETAFWKKVLNDAWRYSETWSIRSVDHRGSGGHSSALAAVNVQYSDVRFSRSFSKVSTYLYFAISWVFWIISGIASFNSIRTCQTTPPTVYLILTYHLNLMTDIAAVAETGLILVAMIFYLKKDEIAWWEWSVSCAGFGFALVGLVSSSWCMNGGQGLLAHFGVGVAVWAVGTPVREWYFWFR